MKKQIPNLPKGRSPVFEQNVDFVDYFSSLTPDEQQGILNSSHIFKPTENDKGLNGNYTDFF
ncbi:MAG: hypothetical protein IJ758_00110 [Clostridia bacterium]|nr:hypothetical protein [Clostridia bacterium]